MNRHLRSLGRLLAGGHNLQLDAIHSIDAVNEEDEDEDECDSEPVHNLGDYGVLRDEPASAVSSDGAAGDHAGRCETRRT